jgi:hypothetical protein
MKEIVKGAVLGAAAGLIIPAVAAIGNEFLWSASSGGTVQPSICFAERLWSLNKIKVIHAKGCKNQLLDSIPFCIVVGTLSGSLVAALAKDNKKPARENILTRIITSSRRERETDNTRLMNKNENFNTGEPREDDNRRNKALGTKDARIKREDIGANIDWHAVRFVGITGGVCALIVMHFTGALWSATYPIAPFINQIEKILNPSSMSSSDSIGQGASAEDNGLISNLGKALGSKYCGNSAQGEKICIERKDVICQYFGETIPHIFCMAVGDITYPSGKTNRWVDSWGSCSERYFACQAAKYYGIVSNGRINQ